MTYPAAISISGGNGAKTRSLRTPAAAPICPHSSLLSSIRARVSGLISGFYCATLSGQAAYDAERKRAPSCTAAHSCGSSGGQINAKSGFLFLVDEIVEVTIAGPKHRLSVEKKLNIAQ